MSISITTSPAEDQSRVRALLQANLLSVFNERDEQARTAAIADTYAENIVWYEPDRVNHGRDALDRRAGELLAESPGFTFAPDGEMAVSQNMGVLSWQFGPAGQPDLLKGVDVVLVEGGKVVALWTSLTKVPS
jgi:hypothetical protein